MASAESEEPVPVVQDSVHEEHAQVAMISRVIGQTASVDVGVSLLREHRGMLGHHFAAEEALDGLFETILDVAPHEEHQVVRFREQHAVVLERIDEVLQRAETGEQPVGLLEEIREIGGLLKAHEAAESSLLLEVFNTDIGTGD